MNIHVPLSGERASWDRQAVFWLTAALLGAALVFGGASRQNGLQVAGLELLCLPLLGLAVWRLTQQQRWRSIAVPAFILLAAAATPLIQLIALPMDAWAALPGREAAGQALRLAGVEDGWRAISLTPRDTWGHFLALLVPAAIFLGVAALREQDRKWLTALIPAAALLSLLVGVAQLGGGTDSGLYFYPTTNRGSAVGFFANRNHQAALLVAALPFAAVWLNFGRLRGQARLVAAAAVVSAVLVTIVGLAIVNSRAGVLLLAPALVGSLALVWGAGEIGGGRRTATILGGVILIALLLAAAFAMGPVMARFTDTVAEGRLTATPIVLEAAWRHLPFGSGIGSFVPVYAGLEPVESMEAAFWNHAHNDYAELLLEGGLMAAAGIAALLVWWVYAAASAWRTPSVTGLARAASVASGLLLVHSTVDYPLRTLAMACVFAFACALMATGDQPARRG